MLTTVNNIYRKKKGKQHAKKSEERITSNMKKKNLKKNSYFIKEIKTKTLTFHQHSILSQNFESFKDKSHKTEWKKNKIGTLQIAQTHVSPTQKTV